MATLEQLIIFFLLIGVGVIARKVGVITPGNTPQLTSLVFNFAMPAIILSGITTEQPHISGKDLSIVLTSAFTTLILLIFPRLMSPLNLVPAPPGIRIQQVSD